jgi:hypothetical protein
MPLIVLEFWPYGLERAGSTADELLDLVAELVDRTHAVFEIEEWRGRLQRRSMAQLRSMATVGGYSPGMKGFTNLLCVPVTSLSVFGDLIAPPDHHHGNGSQ